MSSRTEPPPYSRDTEIRKLKSNDVCQISKYLDQKNSWKKLMSLIPTDLPDDPNIASSNIKKYTNEHIEIISNASKNGSATEILFDEWGTSGRKRPTVGNLLDLLIKAELFGAAEYVAEHCLRESKPKRPLKGPAAKIELEYDTEDIGNFIEDGNYPDTENINEQGSEFNNRNLLFKRDFGYKDVDMNFEKTNPCNIPMLSVFNGFNNIGATAVVSTASATSNSIQINDECRIEATNYNVVRQFLSNGNIIGISNQEDQEMSTENIPNLTLLNIPSSHLPQASAAIENSESMEGIIPDLSALNDGFEGVQTNPNSRCGSFGNSSSLTSDDSHSNIGLPLLSMLEKSNDDSSLTNVTATSDDISLEFDGTSNSNFNPDDSVSNDDLLQK